MKNSEDYFNQTKERIETERERQLKKAKDCDVIPVIEKLKVTAEERNRILNKVRDVFQSDDSKLLIEKSMLLTTQEKDILKEIAGVYYSAYMKRLENLNKKDEGRDDYEK